MRTEPITFVTNVDHEAALTQQAKAYGLSVGQYIQRETRFDDTMPTQQATELSAVIAQIAAPVAAERLMR